MRPEFIPVGQIVNAHGIRGEVKLNPAGFDPAFLAAFDTLYIGGKETKVKSARVHKSTVLLALPGVEDMDAALALKGKPVFIRRTDAHLPEGEYFDAALEGLTLPDGTLETKLIASHDLDLVLETCSRVLLLAGGRLAADGAAGEILRDRTLLEENGLELPLCLAGVPEL